MTAAVSVVQCKPLILNKLLINASSLNKLITAIQRINLYKPSRSNGFHDTKKSIVIVFLICFTKYTNNK